MWGLRNPDAHTQRLITGFAMGIPLIFILAFGPLWSWWILITATAAVGMWEFQKLLFHDRLPRTWLLFYLAGGLAIPLCTALFGAPGLHIALVGGLFTGLTLILALCPLDSLGVSRFAQLALGWLYLPYLLSFILLVAKIDDGRAWMFFTFAITIPGDAGAYYSGRFFGQHKLYESVSPKKTIEGSIGGLLASITSATLLGCLTLKSQSVGNLILLSGCLGIIAQIGDLLESMIKRVSGKKDSSGILPGHGGVLDRIDSLLFLFPAVWLLN